MFRSLSAKIWLPFTILFFIITIVFNLYYPQKQEDFYVKNKNNELKELSKTVGLGVELSISEDNFQGLKKTLDFASGRSDFEFIAIVINEVGKESVFASFPDTLSEKEILTNQPKKYIYQRSKFYSNDFQGYILIAASKTKMAEELAALNRPIYLSSLVIFILTFLSYLLVANRLTRPLVNLLKVTTNMRNENFKSLPNQKFSTDEIGKLGFSIHELQEKLIEQRTRNKELYEGLEDQIKLRTQELEKATEDLIASQSAASLANYWVDVNSGQGKFPKLIFNLLDLKENTSLDLNQIMSYMLHADRNSIRSFMKGAPEQTNFKKELCFKSANNNIFWLSVSGIIKRDSHTAGIIVSGLLQDITERKNYETEIKRLSLVAQNTSNSVIIMDADQKIIWVNESTLSLTGYSRDEIIGHYPKMFQFEKTAQSTIQLIREKISQHQSVTCEILNRSKQGREYWLELNIVPLFNDSGAVYGYIAVETDITLIKEASIELKANETQLRNILDNSAEMIHTLDHEGTILWANKSWKDNLKVTDEEILNRNISDFLDDQTKLEFQDVMPRLMTGDHVNDLNCGFISTDGKLILLEGQTIPLFENDQFIGSQAYLHNITQIVKAKEELKMISNMQEILMEISFDFLNATPNETKDIVLNSFKKIGTFMDVSLISTLNLVDDKSILDYQLVKREQNDWEINSAKYNALDANDTQNRLIIPLLRDNLVIGDLLFVFQEDKQLSQQEIKLLKLYTTLLTNVENRFKSFSELSEAKKEIELINSSLESKVLENTKRNLNLSKTIVEQEKMATIGEISAGIAHDLNTPLGSIKTGTESIGYSLENIFKSAHHLTEGESNLIVKLSSERKIDVFIGGLQIMRETKIMMEFLKNTKSFDQGDMKKLADLLIKCRISKDENELIAQIIQLPNTLIFLEVLFGMLTTNSLLSSVSDSVSRATEVVQNIRSFIKKDISSGLVRKEINLNDNIRVVLNIFNFEFKKSMNLEVDLPDNLLVKGFDVKLFQLWSNLIKNAIDAMENTTSKRLIIKGFEEENKVVISISNSGEMIPAVIQDHIFKKFFSTKKDKNGTGLGLSIVQSVIDEHNAQISLTSSEEITTFSVRFNKN